jgi:hypothetical protein
MNHPPAAGRKQLDAVQRVFANELKRHQQPAQHRNRQ